MRRTKKRESITAVDSTADPEAATLERMSFRDPCRRRRPGPLFAIAKDWDGPGAGSDRIIPLHQSLGKRDAEQNS